MICDTKQRDIQLSFKGSVNQKTPGYYQNCLCVGGVAKDMKPLLFNSV